MLFLLWRVELKAQFTGDTLPCPDVAVTYTYKMPVGSNGTFFYDGSASFVPEYSGVMEPDFATLLCKITWKNAWYYGDGKNPKPSKLIIQYYTPDGKNKYDTLIVHPKVITPYFRDYILGVPADLSCNYTGPLQFGVDIATLPNASSASASVDSGWSISPIPGTNTDFQLNVNNNKSAHLTVNITSVCGNTSSATYTISRNGLSYPTFARQPTNLCANTPAIATLNRYPGASSYTWTANNSNVLMNGVANTLTTPDSSITLTLQDPASTGYQVLLTVKANLPPAARCEATASNPYPDSTSATLQTYLFVGGTPSGRPSIVSNSGTNEVGLVVASLLNATEYDWFIDGSLVGTSAGPSFSAGVICGKHTVGVQMYREGCGFTPMLTSSFTNNCTTEGLSASMIHPSTEVKNLVSPKDIFKVYPNPALAKVSMTIPEAYLNGWLRVYDLHGSLLKASYISSTNQELELRGLAAGVYVISLEKSTLEKQTIKIVKQ